MTTVILVVVIAAAALALAAIVNRRNPDAPTTPQFAVPQQLDRNDFEDATQEWALVMFTSGTCMTCRDAREMIEPVRATPIDVTEVSYETHRGLHERYGINGVPTLVLADQHGVVRWSFLGAPPAEAIGEMLVAAGVVPPESGTGVDFP